VVRRDNRITIKIDRGLGQAIEAKIREHPEWGVASISEFIRRAIDSELRYREQIADTRVLGPELTPGGPQAGNRGKGP
jgi:hypothetical protein